MFEIIESVLADMRDEHVMENDLRRRDILKWADAIEAALAAQSDLLEACKEAFGALVGSHAADDSVQGRARNKVRAAIAKAEGK